MKDFKFAAVTFALASLLCGAGVGARAQDAAAQPPEKDERLALILERARAGVERYHRGMFRIAFTEVLRSEELREDMTPKRSKEFVFECVVLRESLSPEEGDYVAEIVRRLKTVDGRPAKKGERDVPEEGVSIDYLNFLLPKWAKLYRFTLEGEEALRGRQSFRVALLPPGQEPLVEWKGTSFRVSAPRRWSFWVDAERFDILQVESHLAAPFEFERPRSFSAGPFGRFGPSRRLRYARLDSSVRFRLEHFKDPEQALMVPDSADEVMVIAGARRPRLRTTISFTNYRRFVSGVRVIEDKEPDE